jgi:hypothetical protein
VTHPRWAFTPRGVDGDRLRRDRNDVTEVARSGPDWVSFAIEVTDTVRTAIPFDRCTWRTVGPGTVLFAGSEHRDVSCSGTWLTEHEYAIEDVNKWWFPARGGHAGSQKTTCRAHLCGGRALDRPAGRGATTRDAVAVEAGPSKSTQVP